MRISIGSMLMTAVLIFPSLATAAGPSQGPAGGVSIDDTATINVLALAADEQAKREKLDVLLSPIQSASDLAAYLESMDSGSPLRSPACCAPHGSDSSTA